jgi:pyrroline-5-carboxylate reductase
MVCHGAMAEPSLTILGCGTMGQAILTGLLRSARFTSDRLTATVRRPEVARRLSSTHGVEVGTDNVAACRAADIALVALKPQRLASLLDDDDIRAALANKLLISIAAGVRVRQLGRWLPGTAVIRAMPNTPCLIDAGMTVLAPGPGATDAHMATAREIFESVGRVVELEDKHMDAVTSLNGSGPAFAYVMLEAMADGGVMMGLPRDTALQIAAQVFLGSSKMVLQTGAHPAALKDQVTTPAGSTIAGLLTMEDGRIRSVLARAIQEATKVAAELGHDDPDD